MDPGCNAPRGFACFPVPRGMQILRHNADYRNLLAGRALWFWGLIAVPFYTLLAKRVLEARMLRLPITWRSRR